MTKRSNLPKSIYVERWPEWSGRDDVIHYAPTGYGVDMQSGATSRIVEYVRAPAKKRRKAQP